MKILLKQSADTGNLCVPTITKNLIYANECYQVIGICMKVHNYLGNGFREVVYKDALETELKIFNIPYRREVKFWIEYAEKKMAHTFNADFLLFDKIILEVKASSSLHPDNYYQTLNYIKAASLSLGLLVNFGESKLRFKRIINTYPF